DSALLHSAATVRQSSVASPSESSMMMGRLYDTPAVRIWLFCDSTSSSAQRMAAPSGVSPPATSCGGEKAMASVQSPMIATLPSPPKEMTSTRPQRAAIGSALRSAASALSPSFSSRILFSSCMLPEQSSTSTSGARSSLLSMRATSGMTVLMRYLVECATLESPEDTPEHPKTHTGGTGGCGRYLECFASRQAAMQKKIPLD